MISASRDWTTGLGGSPVFIGGCPRSGTTLLARLVAGRTRKCFVTPESQFKFNLLGLGTDGTLTDERLEEAKRALEGSWRLKLWELDSDVEGIISRAECATPRSIMEEVLECYQRSHGLKDRGLRWIDHTPSNVTHCHLLMTAWPNARYVHIVRDGRAVLASVRGLDWGPCTAAAAAEWWCARVAQGLSMEKMTGSSCITVRFEDLVRVPGESLDRIVSFLQGDPGKKESTAQAFLPRYSQGQHELVMEPPDAERAVAWRDELPERDLVLFESRAGSVLRALGYELSTAGSPRARRGVELVRDTAVETAGEMRGKVLRRLRRGMAR